MLDKCENCGSRVVFGGKTLDGKQFCFDECLSYFKNPNFCSKCESESIDESPPYLHLYISGIGVGFPQSVYGKSIYNFAVYINTLISKSFGSFFKRETCSICNSTIRRYWFLLAFIPIIPLSRYRVKFRTPKDMICRKINPTKLDFIYRVGFFPLFLLTFSLVATLSRSSNEYKLEKSACPLVTQIIHEQFKKSATCKVVKMTQNLGNDFYKAEATLDNGNDIKITVERKGDNIEVTIPPQ